MSKHTPGRFNAIRFKDITLDDLPLPTPTDAMKEAAPQMLVALKFLLDGIWTYGPDYMHGCPKKEYIKVAQRAIAAAEGEE